MRNQVQSTLFLIGLFCLGGLVSCASSEKKEVCPTEQEAPISACRAQEKCKSKNSSVGLGVGLGLGNFGFGVGRSQQTRSYTDCIDKELAEQKVKQLEAEKKAQP